MNDKWDCILQIHLKAGKRIYYLDVKEEQKRWNVLAVTESKKVVTGERRRFAGKFLKNIRFSYIEKILRNSWTAWTVLLISLTGKKCWKL